MSEVYLGQPLLDVDSPNIVKSPCPCEPGTDWFSIAVLILMIAIGTYVVLTVLYFANIANNTPPSLDEANMLTWTGIAIAVVITVIFLYAIVRLFSYRTYFCAR